MELLAVVLAWPLILLVLGLVFISLNALNGGFVLLSIFLLLFLVFASRYQSRDALGKISEIQKAEYLRKGIVTFSIALLLPIFVRYVVDLSGNSLAVVIGGLLAGFGVTIWGMFIKNHRVLTYSNIIGGALIIIYIYIQLWELGELPRIIAAAFGLVLAVIVSVVKFREKLA